MNEKTTEAKTQIDHALDTLATQLSQGHSEAFLAYLKVMGSFHQYSHNNQMLISMQRPEATRVAGFGTWKKHKRWVKKGEKGIMILAPVVKKDKEAREDGETVVGFRTAYVFDVEQTEGEPLPTIQKGQGDLSAETLKEIIGQCPHPVSMNPHMAARGQASKERGIQLNPRELTTPASMLVTLFHEWAHMILHMEVNYAAERDRCELEAESTAYALASLYGVDSLQGSADYIQSWRGDKEALRASLTNIHKAIGQIARTLDLKEKGVEA